MPQTAVSILRVSTKKQLNEGEGIENQRRGNAEYIRRKGYRLVREFVIAETADDREREDFETVIAQVIAHRREIDVVVFWKVDRISRGGVLPYFTLKGVLDRHGVRVEFATEQIDASASGELMETLLAGMARFENRLRVERTIGAERILTKDGYWCRAAPTGFRNGRLDGKPVLLPIDDPAQWELLSFGLRKQLTGAFPQAEVAAELRAKGLRSNRGTLICNQTWMNICRSPVYGGLLFGEWTDGVFVRAKFDGPLTPNEWQDLQRVLDGRQRLVAPAPRQNLHPDFPLRRFLLCPGCGRSARGYDATGRLGRRFAYYDCQQPACEFRVPAADAHKLFADLLTRVTPKESLLALFREVVLRVWEDTCRELEAHRQVGQKNLSVLETEKGQLLTLMKRSATNADLLAALERDFERAERELSLARVTADGTDSIFARYDKEEVVDVCVKGLRDVCELWQEWPVEGKSRIQRLVFPQGLRYDVLTGYRTPQLSLVYAAIPNTRALKTNMAPPMVSVTNQLIQELIAWYEVLKAPLTDS